METTLHTGTKCTWLEIELSCDKPKLNRTTVSSQTFLELEKRLAGLGPLPLSPLSRGGDTLSSTACSGCSSGAGTPAAACPAGEVKSFRSCSARRSRARAPITREAMHQRKFLY